MDIFFSSFVVAIKAIRENRLRTGLTMLGIIIGISSVIAVMMLGNGASEYISGQVSIFNGNMASINIDTRIAGRAFRREDIDLLKENVPEILGASFSNVEPGIVHGTKDIYDANIYTVCEDFQYDNSPKIRNGTYLTEDQVRNSAKVCVLMETDARNLFGTADVLGRTLEITSQGKTLELEIVGIKNDWDKLIAPLMSLGGYRINIEMPVTTYAEYIGIQEQQLTRINVYWTDEQAGSRDSYIPRKAISFFESMMGLKGEKAFSWFSEGDGFAEMKGILNAVKVFVSLVAGISLVVGGIGVMNIMLVSVTERTREIGIRKAIGIRTGAIVLQFIMESAILALIGGIIGIFTGIAASFIGGRILEFSVKIDPFSIITAAISSAAVGLFFGMYPALRAARLRPIEALQRRSSSSPGQIRIRSFLTMLGIIIGIAPVLTILAVGEGMKHYVSRSLDDYAKGCVSLKLDPKKTDRFFTAEELDEIEKALPDIYGLSPTYTEEGTGFGRFQMSALVAGGTPIVERENSGGVRGFYAGRNFTDYEVESASLVCVMNQASAVRAFGTYDVVDRTIQLTLGGRTFELTVVGVMNSAESHIRDAFDAVANDKIEEEYGRIFVPYTLLTRKFEVSSDRITSFTIYTKPGLAQESALRARSVTENVMHLRGQDAVIIESNADESAVFSTVLNIATIIVAVVAGIALLVGGIGVMNIMLVTVTEHTREIGIRRSLGARTFTILLQFITISAKTTLIGGLIGTLLGLASIFVLKQALSFAPVLKNTHLLLVLMISVSEGLVFGVYPAWKAARMNPVDALRYE